MTTVSIEATVLQVYSPKHPGQEDHLAAVDSEWQLSQFGKLAPSRLIVGAVARRLADGERPEDGILAAAKELNADAIWMATQGRSLARHVLLGSTALGALNKATVPVALIRPRK